jgi:hypothetical protein
MKARNTHCVAGAKGSMERGSVENPAVATVANACPTALKRLMWESTPVHPSVAKTVAATTVIPTYRVTNRLADSRMVASSPSSGPGISVLKSA